MDWKYRPGSIICCVGPGNFYAEICAPYDIYHRQWWARNIFEDNTLVVDDANINVITMDELDTIRTWMKPYRQLVPHDNVLPAVALLWRDARSILQQPVHQSPFRVPHECTYVAREGRRSGRLQKPPLRYIDRQGGLQDAKLPHAWKHKDKNGQWGIETSCREIPASSMARCTISHAGNRGPG